MQWKNNNELPPRRHMLLTELVRHVEFNYRGIYTIHKSECDWGGALMLTTDKGHGFARIYFYHDTPGVLFLDWLSVDETQRKKGIANQLLSIHKKLASMTGTKARLEVERGTWMYEWYQRKGYLFQSRSENNCNDWLECEPEKQSSGTSVVVVAIFDNGKIDKAYYDYSKNEWIGPGEGPVKVNKWIFAKNN